MKDIPEKDWKIIRSLKDSALDIASKRILEKSSRIIEDNDKNAHARYLDLFKTIHNEDDQIGHMFNDLKRSTAIFKLSLWKFHDLISEEDMKSISQETQKKVDSLIDSYNEDLR